MLLFPFLQAKKFNKALKIADSILSSFPTHGETLAMKGLLCNTLGRKEEAYKLVKQGLTCNLKSPTCWHVYGLVYRSDKNYQEAIKCYKNAIRMDQANSPNLGMILRDLSQMQIQTRDLEGFLDSRKKLLKLGNNVGFSSMWVSLALGHHLLKQYDIATVVLQSYREAMQEQLAKEPYELSEILLYEVQIYFEGSMFEKALDALDSASAAGLLKDKIGALELRAQLLASLGRVDECKDAYHQLLDMNTENHRYHEYLIGVCRENGEDLDEMYRSLAAKYPRSRSCKRIPLDFLPAGDRFQELLRSFVEDYIQRGIPSLFTELIPLYNDPEKAALIGATLCELQRASAKKEDSFWVRVCLSMHYSWMNLHAEATDEIDGAISQAPEESCLIDAYSAKSKILDKQGDLIGAAEMAESARKLDLADRYLNCQASLALFKSLQPEAGEKVSHMFTKEGEVANNNFYDMQATWYEMASGKCYFEMKDYGKALKRFKKVEEHFSEFIDDQFDFFLYCTRKHTMRGYVDTLRMMDGILEKNTILDATEAAVEVYLHLHEHPYKTELELLEERVGSMNPDEAKKERQKLRKKMKKKEDQLKKNVDPPAGAKDVSGKKKDDDPNGERLLQVSDPLGEAKSMIQKLITGAPNVVRVPLMAYRVDVQRNEALLALEHVQSAIGIAGVDNPRVHECIVDLAVRAMNSGDNEHWTQLEKAKDKMEALLDSKSPADYHASWKDRNSNSGHLEVEFVAAKMDMRLCEEGSVDIWNAFVGLLLDKPDIVKRAGFEECRRVLNEIEPIMDENLVEKYKGACAKVFTRSDTFLGKLGMPEVAQLAQLNLNGDAS
jgi:tetratricopeptide (TPR) repeat protein